jgi:hypothetical protein
MSVETKLSPEQVQELAIIRKDRREKIKDAFQANRKRMISIKKVRDALARGDGPMTILEIAEATGFEAPEVLWCVMAMKKYGIIGERDNDGGYFRYGLEAATADVPEDDD